MEELPRCLAGTIGKIRRRSTRSRGWTSEQSMIIAGVNQVKSKPKATSDHRSTSERDEVK
jgi:hypothetical protein